MTDINTLLQVLVERGPFNKASEKLVSLSTGLVAEESVNADDAKRVGQNILTSMVGHTVASYKFSQKNQVKTLASATHVKTNGGERIEMDPQRLYQRLVVTGICDIAMDDLFRYELCSFPTSLFDNHVRLRTGDKAELLHHLVKLVPGCIISVTPDLQSYQFILDGGALLHRFTWPKHSTYAEICAMYSRHVLLTYGHALVVFDGYHGASTKDEAHRRRIGPDVGAAVSVSADMSLTMSKKAFLANTSNKQALINLLAQHMIEAGIKVEQAEGDADYTISRLACQSAQDKPTAVVAEDTDIFQLMIHHTDATNNNLYMVTSKQMISISTIKQRLDPTISASLLFLHAISGCDTTSRPFGIGKVTALTKHGVLKKAADVFMLPTSSKKDIEKAGADALLEIYGCTSLLSLNAARVTKFLVKVATSTQYVSPEKLPPTIDAAAFHSQRTYHQVQAWCGNDVSPEDWGWTTSSGSLYPVKMTEPAAPERLLKMIRCNCGGQCDKKTCTCRKNGLQCTPACGQCKGITCMNASQVATTEDNDDDVDDDNT